MMDKINDLDLRGFKRIFLTFLILMFFLSCSTISKIDRSGKDFVIDNKNFDRLNGRYDNNNDKSTWTIYDMLYDRKLFHKKLDSDCVSVVIKTINDKELELSFVIADTCIKKQKLRGRYENGYFSVNTKFGFLSPLFPILWGPGTYDMSIGLTNNDSLVILESHGGIAIFLAIPFIASGGKNYYEFQRLK